MRINPLSLFFKDLLLILTRTIDGFFSLLCCIFFVIKSINPKIVGVGGLDWWVYLLLILPIILMLVKFRIDQDESTVFNIGAFLSVAVLSLIFAQK